MKRQLSLGDYLRVFTILVGVIGAIYLYFRESKTRITIPVARRDLPAYHQIQASDLTDKTSTDRKLTSNTLKRPQDIVGRYTLTNISKNEPLKKDKLVPVEDIHLITNTIALAIPATPDMVLGGNLRAGDVVDIMLISERIQEKSIPKSINFNKILVLDVKPVSKSESTTPNLSSDFIVVIAIPQQRKQEFVINSVGAKLLITRKL